MDLLEIDSCVHSRVELITVNRTKSPNLLPFILSDFDFEIDVVLHFVSFDCEILRRQVAET